MATNLATTKEKGEYEEDFTPKTANRKIRKPMLIGAALVILLAGLGMEDTLSTRVTSITRRIMPRWIRRFIS